MKRTRRTLSSEFKAQVALEAIKEIKTVSEIAQQYQIHPNQVSRWKKEFLANAGKVFDSGNEEKEQISLLKKEKEDLVQQIGQLTVDNNWLKKNCYDTLINTQRLNRQGSRGFEHMSSVRDVRTGTQHAILHTSCEG